MTRKRKISINKNIPQGRIFNKFRYIINHLLQFFLQLSCERFRFRVLPSFEQFLNHNFPPPVLVLVILLPEFIILDVPFVQSFPQIQFSLLAEPSSGTFEQSLKLSRERSNKVLVLVVFDELLVLLRVLKLNYLQIFEYLRDTLLPSSLVSHSGLK